MQSSRDKLILENLRLVYFMYHKLGKSDLANEYEDDIISEGMIGLIQAASSFDETRKVKFSSYASVCITNHMLMFLRKQRKYEKYEVSLYTPIGHDTDGEELTYADVLEERETPKETSDAVLDFKAFLGKQSELDRKILVARVEGYRQQEIGEKLGFSQSHIAKRMAQAKANYKAYAL